METILKDNAIQAYIKIKVLYNTLRNKIERDINNKGYLEIPCELDLDVEDRNIINKEISKGIFKSFRGIEIDYIIIKEGGEEVGKYYNNKII